MLTKENPNYCPKCNSKDIYLGACEYVKDEDYFSVDKVISGTWFCKNCGNVLGTKNKGTNDIDPDSF